MSLSSLHSTTQRLERTSARFQSERALVTSSAVSRQKQMPKLEKLVRASLREVTMQVELNPKLQSQFGTLLQQAAKKKAAAWLKQGKLKEKELPALFKEVDKVSAVVGNYCITLMEIYTDSRFPHPRFEQYHVGSPIPRCVAEFNPKLPHTIPLHDYLDVRMSKMIQSIVQEKKQVEVFIGPVRDIDPYYHQHGFKRIAQLHTKSSIKYFLLYNESTGEERVLISGISNNSKLTHTLLQLKVAGINLKSVAIRGQMSESIRLFASMLEEHFARAVGEHPIALGIIGNRSQMVIDLARRLYPEEMELAPSGEDELKDFAAALLREKNSLVTRDVDGIFKFSTVTVEVDGRPQKVVAFRMPNGDLSEVATRMMFFHPSGMKGFVMVGAGGSLNEHSKVGHYQLTTAAHIDGERPLVIDPRHMMKLDFASDRMLCLQDATNETVISPLVETQEWFRGAKGARDSVDVETYYILRAASTAYRTHEHTAKIFPGLFVSDEVGIEPLVKKINPKNAWPHLSELLEDSFDYVGVPTSPTKEPSGRVTSLLDGIDSLEDEVHRIPVMEAAQHRGPVVLEPAVMSWEADLDAEAFEDELRIPVMETAQRRAPVVLEPVDQDWDLEALEVGEPVRRRQGHGCSPLSRACAITSIALLGIGSLATSFILLTL